MEHSEEFKKKYAGIGQKVLELIPFHFSGGHINLDTLQKAVRDEFSSEPERNLDTFVENICFMLQEKSHKSKVCIRELAKTITITL